VVIGRLTVQANLPAKPPMAPLSSPLAPRLSLDDYLKSRGGPR